MEKSILSYDQSATFDSPSQSLNFLKKIFICQKKVDNIWTIYILRAQGLREVRLEIPEHDPLFLNTDLVSSRGLCWRQISILKQNLLANFAELQV